MKYSVLIVDDEYYICEGVRQKLVQLNFSEIEDVRFCLSGEDALALCKIYKPQIVITDIKMSGMGGIELIQRLGEKLHPVRFLALSGYDDFEYVKGAFQHGAVDYLLKPLLTSALQSALKSAIAELKSADWQNGSPRSNQFHQAKSILEKVRATSDTASLPEEAESLLRHLGTGKRYFVSAVLFAVPPLPRDTNRFMNTLYDAFDSHGLFLCCLNSDTQVFILAEEILRKDFLHYCSEVILASAQKAETAVTVSLSHSIQQLPAAYAISQNLLLTRLAYGFGKVYQQSDSSADNGELSSKMKHLVSQFLQNPMLVTLETMQVSFITELQKIPVARLAAFYNHFNHLLDWTLMNQGSGKRISPIKSVYSFHSYQTLWEYLYTRLREICCSMTAAPKSPHVLQAVKEYIDLHYTENLTLTSIADRFFISYSYLSKLFQKTFHMTFLEYVYMLRMEQALSLLQQPKRSIQSIASQIGYENSFNFSRAFKTYYGVAPSYYRKKLVGPEE